MPGLNLHWETNGTHQIKMEWSKGSKRHTSTFQIKYHEWIHPVILVERENFSPAYGISKNMQAYRMVIHIFCFSINCKKQCNTRSFHYWSHFTCHNICCSELVCLQSTRQQNSTSLAATTTRCAHVVNTQAWLRTLKWFSLYPLHQAIGYNFYLLLNIRI